MDSATATALDRRLSSHYPLGASTGYLERSRGKWDELLLQSLAVSTFAAEFAALSEPEFDGLARFLNDRPRLPFVYLSVHGPVKQLKAPEHTLVSWLDGLSPRVESIVVHPDTLESLDAYRRLGRRLVVENMDRRKAGGRTADELAAVFAGLPEAGFCFDIAHAWSIDPTMGVANELLDRFADRLRQVHLSSLEDGKHVPLLREHETLFGPVLERCSDVPWILEAAKPLRWDEPHVPDADAADSHAETVT